MGIGAVLLQDNRPIAFLSKALAPKHLGMSTYEKELLAVIFAVEKWRHYLLGRRFMIKTDHQSLRYLLDQRVSTANQQKWITKLMGMDYDICYKKGKDNIVADSLSRQMEGTQPASRNYALTSTTPTWLEQLSTSWFADTTLADIIAQLSVDPTSNPGYTFTNGRLRFEGKLVVGNDGLLKQQLLHEFHSTATGGHSGRRATYERINHIFYWPTIRADVTTFVSQCEIC